MQTQVNFSYFYGEESEQFSYFRIPRLLVRSKKFKTLSTDAKLLYSLIHPKVLFRFSSIIRSRFLAALRLLQKQAHIGFCFFGGKANVVQRQNDTEPLQIFVIVLPYTHHFFDCVAQSPALILLQDGNRDIVVLACFLLRHPINSRT